MSEDRYTITELDPCVCTMRRFEIIDHEDGDARSTAHVGHLNPHDSSHRQITALLAAERAAAKCPECNGPEH